MSSPLVSEQASVARFSQDLVAELVVHGADLGDEAAAEPRAHAHVELVELGRRPVGGDHHLAPAVDQRVQRVAELLLDGRALQELHVVDQQNVDLAQLLLEGERIAGAQGLHEARHEALGGEIEHLRLGLPLLHVPGDGVQQMGFAEPHIAVHEQGVEQRLRGREGPRHLLRRGVSQPVRGADQEARKAEPRIERRALEAAIAGAQRHRQRRRLRRRLAPAGARLARRLLGRLDAEMRLPDPEFDALDRRPFAARKPQHEVVIMRAEPVPEEAGRHREVDDLVVHLLDLHPPKPTGEDVLSQLSA